jgi:hypothetical protein
MTKSSPESDIQAMIICAMCDSGYNRFLCPMAAGTHALTPPPSGDIRYPSIFNTPIVAILF